MLFAVGGREKAHPIDGRQALQSLALSYDPFASTAKSSYADAKVLHEPGLWYTAV